MKPIVRIAIMLLLVVFLSTPTNAQPTDQNKSKANYELAKKANVRSLFRSLGDTTLQPHWVSSHSFWYSFRTSTETKYVFVNAEEISRIVLFNNEKFSKAFTALTGENA